MAEVEPRAVPEHLAIERRLSIQECDRESELTGIKSARLDNIGYEELWLGPKQGWLGQFFDVCVSHGSESFAERLPALKSGLLRHQFLRSRQLEAVG